MFDEIRNVQGERLDTSYHAGRGDRKQIVVVGHGVTGNKDRPFLVSLSEGLADAGIASLRVSFSGNGNSEGKFEESTVSKEVEDLGAVLDALKGYTVCYAGHSMGGAVGVLRTSRDERIRYLVSLAGMVHTKAFAEREFGDVKPDEGHMWEDPACPLSQVFMDDMAQIDSVVNLAPQIKVPWLLVHGTGDDVVPTRDSLDIYKRANSPKELVEIKAADHVFSGAATLEMVKQVVGWVSARFG